MFSFLGLWGLFLAALTGYVYFMRIFSWELLFRWGFVSLVIILLLSIDLMGSTPLFKSGLHEDRLLKVTLNKDLCRGAGFCEQVCPKNCFEMDQDRKKTNIHRTDDCIQCGACIVQCPFDALHFQSPDGKIISPETIRTFKLNLMGTRLIKR
jgi:NAD-dependent dihydropyrimidine dehydrogenase PreA subunit